MNIMMDAFIHAVNVYENEGLVVYFNSKENLIFKRRKDGAMKSWLMDARLDELPKEAQDRILAEKL